MPDDPQKKPVRRTGLDPSVAHDLLKLIEYSEVAVVSRTLVSSAAGTITLFSFDEGQGLSEHTAPFDAFVEIVDGEADITIAGESVRACRGQVVLMPAGVPHALQAVTPFKMLLVMIRG